MYIKDTYLVRNNQKIAITKYQTQLNKIYYSFMKKFELAPVWFRDY